MKERVVQGREFQLLASVDQRAQPIFILGIKPRSGTHFLANLLCLHPDCTKSAIPEDRLLTRVTFLDQYVEAMLRQWPQLVKETNLDLRSLLFENLGEGLINFLRQARTEVVEDIADRFPHQVPTEVARRRIVTKTPQVNGLEHFFRLVPRGQLLILVRDGRAVVESYARSFRGNRESAIRAWAQSARKIIEFDRSPSNANRSYLIVRYEDLVTDTESQVRQILYFLGLDLDRYNFQAARNVPVVGSSTFKRGDGPVHWFPMRKTADFNPLARADHWRRAQHERFNWLAAEQLKAFGYEPKTYATNNAFWTLWNCAMDLKWSSKTLIRRINSLLHSAPGRLKTAFFDATG
jgi:protein-tyrosine sulfotransferase